jgi:predicted DNA-binding transcriptional regulator AlpA
MDDVCIWLGVSRSWVKNHVTRDEPILPHVRIAGTVRFRRADIETFLQDQITSTPNWAKKAA